MRAGKDARIPRDRETGAELHTLQNVYSEMLLQVCRDYSGLPDPRTLTLTEIRYFYNGGRRSLQQLTAPRKP